MLSDPQYLNQKYRLSEIPHHYGENVHLLSHPFLFTLLAKLGSVETQQPLIHQLLQGLYDELVRIVVNAEFPQIETEISTRMSRQHPEGRFTGRILDPKTKVVCVNLARAGTVPSHICYDAFNYLLDPAGVRQDHISINRKLNEQAQVVGTDLGGLKIGGEVQDRYVIFPDPMGATGSTIVSAMHLYAKRGKARRYIAMHLIVTPEYLKTVTKEFPDLVVYAIRLDRGLSPKNVLTEMPGSEWDNERGLNSRHYIVPGAGGLGELINNAEE